MPGYDPLDYHDPTRGVAGAPPARSALGLRLALAIFGVLVCTAGVVTFVIVGQPFIATAVAALALIALIDIVVVVRRMRYERRLQRLLDL